MKQHNKEKRLKARQKGYDDLIKQNASYASCYKRPGSMKK